MTVDEACCMVGAEDESVEEMSTSEYSFGSEEGEESFMDLGNSFQRPFDINMLKESIEAGSKILEHVTNKNVVLVIGKTGAGKSTFIQGIAGKTLQETVHVTQCDGKAVEKNVYDSQDALPEFKIGHATSSQTKAFCYFVPPKQDGKEEIVYIDTPGFEDTHHEEIDIATSVMFSRIAEKCKSLRFVVLINYTSLLEDRGGAARSILRFTRAFVKDFSEDKKGFMFLFTHTNEISGVSDDLGSSRKALLDEIMRLRAGSVGGDYDLLKLLDFLKVSLKQNFPFADVLHPLESDFTLLRKKIERKLTPIENPALAECCGLTGTSRSSLRREIGEILLETCTHLQSNPPDVKLAQKNHELLQFLTSQINFSEIKTVASDCTAHMQAFIREQESLIQTEIKKGNDDNSVFGPNNAIEVREALQRLDVVGAQDLAKAVRNEICKTISSMAEGLGFSEAPMSYSSARRLNILHSWCNVTPDFKGHYNQVLSGMHTVIGEINDKVNGFSFTEDKKSEAISDFICNICFLESIIQQEHVLLRHELDLKSAREALEYSLDASRKFFSSFPEEDSFDLKEYALNSGELDGLATKLGTLDAIYVGLESQEGLAGLKSDALRCRTRLQTVISFQFENLCNDAKHAKISELREPLHQLRSILTRCKTATDVFSVGLRQIYNNLLHVVEEKFRSTSTSIPRVPSDDSMMSVNSGREAGVALNDFSKHMWFDDFLPRDTPFISAKHAEIVLGYEGLCRKCKEQAVVCLKLDTMKTPTMNKSSHLEVLSALKEMECIYDGFLEIEAFAKIIQNDNMLADCKIVRLGISAFATSAMGLVEGALSTGELRLGDEVATEVFFLLLNDCLEEIKRLQAFTGSADSDKLDAIRKQIIGIITAYADTIHEEFSFGKSFETMAGLLTMLANLENEENTHICRMLPTSVDSRERARHSVMKHAEKVRKCITETSNWEEIDQLIEVLENAVALDLLLNGEINSQVQTLKIAMDGKEVKVDLRIDEMIASGDFLGVVEFLSPLSESRDQLKRDKFNRYHSEIERWLKKCGLSVNNASKRLPSAEVSQAIVRSLGGLNEATQTILESCGGKNSENREIRKLRHTLSNGARSLKSKLNKKLKNTLIQMEMNLQSLNVARLAAERIELIQFVELVDTYIDVANRKRHEKFEKDYDDLLLSLPRYMKDFIESWFKKGKKLVLLLRAFGRVPQSGNAETLHILELYRETKEDLNNRIAENIRVLETGINQGQCYGEGVSVLRSLQRHADAGLKEHLSDENSTTIKSLLDLWLVEQEETDSAFNKMRGHSEQSKCETAAKLDRHDPSTAGFFTWRKWHGSKEYDSIQRQTEELCVGIYNKGIMAMQSGNFALVNECLEELAEWDIFVHRHVKSTAKNLMALQHRVRNKFLDVCKQLNDVFHGRSALDHRSLFDDFRRFIICMPLVLEEKQCTRAFATTNQLYYSKLESEVSKVKSALTLETFFCPSQIRTIVENARIFGDFMTDYYLVFIEEYGRLDLAREDPWMRKIAEVCHEHFSTGRNVGNMKYYVALGVLPSASYGDIKRAYQDLAKRFHPDKVNEENEKTNEKFRTIQVAWEAIRETHREDSSKKPFDGMVYGFGECLLKVVRERLGTQQYGAVAQVLDLLDSIGDLQVLVSRPLETNRIEERVNKIVRNHVSQARTSVNTHWAERKYKELQEDIDDLKSMEKHLKSHSEVFQGSWNDGIVEMINGEIADLEGKARSCLTSGQVAKERKHDFRRIFLRMGFVLVELPMFKAHAKSSMSSLLKLCLEKNWGYGYLFELGHALRKSDDDDPEENRVGQLVISEFSDFKDIMTMIWNEEILRKPVKDTVKGIVGHTQKLSNSKVQEDLEIHRDELLDYFDDFEARYDGLLTEYLRETADLDSLIQKTRKLAVHLQPVTCAEGWTEKMKSHIPALLAGVFALFTVLKSGDTYTRLQSSSDASRLGDTLLMKPHNIQVLTLLCMFGCGRPSQGGLESQLMQIRTGEGKSMILGAAATVLGLLSFRVRCVCYSEYLSSRDYGLFEEVFKRFKIARAIVYSTIDTYSEDTTAAKGDLRKLTNSLLLGKLPDSRERFLNVSRNEIVRMQQRLSKEEILLVDEVDVFFGKDFYGQTLNHATTLEFPEAAEIMKMIWDDFKCNGELELSDLQNSKAYKILQQKLDGFEYVLDNEISEMLQDVRYIDHIPYVLDKVRQRIGYKTLDSVSYRTQYGYRTKFAYLREYDQGNVNEEVIKKELAVQFLCGQFSYAAISPTRILGVSGTLDVMTRYEKEVLEKYGVNTYLYVPSVYGQSNFCFDQAGEGLAIETSKSEFHYKICEEIKKVTGEKRAVIVFFKDSSAVEDFTSSSLYHKLGRKKKVLSETMIPSEKDFVISKAATSQQITISSAVFGRGTDFFCKDDNVESNGGVHVIQAFLSEQRSEEVQIQGRTARQGKQGSYKLILLEDDLVDTFGVEPGEKDGVARSDKYQWLCGVRERQREQHAKEIEANLAEATENDKLTHEYFDALLASNQSQAASLFKKLYEKRYMN
mmetsp:Transcript_36362/g.88075  ORF Transcript_36362/g.88075 Transcript_36362/m.88075 type:complete len:2533 (-) Transcript_36362:94-7692(-)